MQPSRSREDSLRLQFESAADVKSALHAIGISDQNGWLIAALVYGAGGTGVFLLGVFGLIPQMCQIIAGVAMVVALICAYGIGRWPNGRPQEHLRTSFGLALIFSGAVFAGQTATAMMTLPLLAFVTPCYLYGPRFAAPYALVIVAGIAIVMTIAPGAQTTARIIISCGVAALVIVSMMISEQQTRELARRNRLLAYTDPLTGVANMRRLREDIGATFAKLSSEGEDFALFAIDLDEFKEVNDRFGHGVGDLVLKTVASELATELETGDLVARRGGDEFSILVPSPTRREIDLHELAARFSNAICRARGEACPTVAQTGGVAYVVASRNDDSESILRRADDQLHRVKEARRSQIGERTRGPVRTAHLHRPTPVDDVEESQRGKVRIASARVTPATSRTSEFIVLAAGLAPIAVVNGALASFGLLRPLSPLTGTLTSVSLLALALVCTAAGRRAASPVFLNIAFPMAIALIAIEVALAGAAGDALIDLFLALMFIAVFLFPVRMAAAYAIVCATLFAGFAIGVDYADVVARSAISLIVFLAVIGTVVKVRSITIRFALTNLELSQVDPLTGVANLRALRLRLHSMIAEAERGRGRPMMMSIDLEEFKSVNDRYSHSTGDETLRAVADAISRTAGVDDLVARRGGDEFVVLGEFPGNAEAARTVVRLREEIERVRGRICPDLRGSARIGWSTWEPGDDLATMLSKSDDTLHDAKIASHNQAVLGQAG